MKVLTSASETVCDKLSRANPKYAELIAESVARTASTMRGTLRDKMASFRVALDHVSDLYRHGRLDEEKIAEFAKDRKFDEIVVSLSLLARIDVDTAERALAEAGIQNMLMLAKVTGISWRTTIQVLRARLGSAGISKVELDQAKARFYRINRETARRILMFKARDQNEMTEAEIMSN